MRIDAWEKADWRGRPRLYLMRVDPRVRPPERYCFTSKRELEAMVRKASRNQWRYTTLVVDSSKVWFHQWAFERTEFWLSFKADAAAPVDYKCGEGMLMRKIRWLTGREEPDSWERWLFPLAGFVTDMSGKWYVGKGYGVRGDKSPDPRVAEIALSSTARTSPAEPSAPSR